MKKKVLLALSLFPLFLISQTSIYDIQFTTIAGDGSYPSLYEDETVTTGGIVTVTGFNGGRYFISSPEGGAWNGLFVYDNTYSPALGDSILITGEVFEYNGMTELKDLSAFTVVSSSNPLPEHTLITTAEVTAEAFEGVPAEIVSCEAESGYNEYGDFQVNDGSGWCTVRAGRYSLEDDGFSLAQGYPFASIKGIITDYYGPCLLPGSREDIRSESGALVLSTEEMFISEDAEFELPVKIALLNQSESISTYHLDMTYDESILTYQGFEKAGTLSEPGTLTDNTVTGHISIIFEGDFVCNAPSTLINLNFTPESNGNSNMQFVSPSINGSEAPYHLAGEVMSGVGDCDIPQADTLSIVQRPLLNIPTIVAPGESFMIECFAPENTTNWNAKLNFKDLSIDLSIEDANYNSNLDRWTLQAVVPTAEHFVLYDLEVNASGGISDHVSNAVKVIDAYKEDYYFIQITDTHLPGKAYYGDPGYETDDSELDDLEEVIEDINLLHPEFVLLTGDLLNEGEMEDFECLRHHTKTIELLEKFEVPVYIVPGNHDLGGWEPTPPPQGTARRDWWKFFGWRQREIPPVQEEYYVHDYSFNYGDVHYVGMESSDNYDQYMYDVYGDRGFIPSQLTWLENDLNNADNKTKVLFYHFDFNNDINLNALGADMALWGHQHSSTNDFSHPYNIGTENVCNNTGGYRVIRVNQGELTPEYTSYTGSGGQNLEIDFSDENNGTVDSLAATITNNQNLAFADAVVKFVMPHSEQNFTVTNGTLEQLIRQDEKDICYVNVSLDANSETTVIVKQGGGLSSVGPVNPDDYPVSCYPNPFHGSTRISFQLKRSADVQLEVYNTAGHKIKVLFAGMKEKGVHSINWDGTNDSGTKVKDGVYFYRYLVDGRPVAVEKMVLLN